MQAAESPRSRSPSDNAKRHDEGRCSECTLLSRKLRLCITCAVKAGVLKHNDDKKDFVLNVENNDIEVAFQRAKKNAICRDCALDGVQHEGHKTMQLKRLEMLNNAF
ncbi:hypothetical protein B9Z55_012750 [Caenorhabditis nigoni]|uniref:Uncharacterized protein n=1 Tax=Caenorhabditis nigoni TaxID=1611254 RepID=A0A2G5TYQ5_9PELO|nr:hypothetical protein B9Z55_012750 [Caenorhabditis nigoni]